MNLNDNGHLAVWINIFFVVAAISVAYAAAAVTLAVRQLRAAHGRPTPRFTEPVFTAEESIRHAA